MLQLSLSLCARGWQLRVRGIREDYSLLFLRNIAPLSRRYATPSNDYLKCLSLLK